MRPSQHGAASSTMIKNLPNETNPGSRPVSYLKFHKGGEGNLITPSSLKTFYGEENSQAHSWGGRIIMLIQNEKLPFDTKKKITKLISLMNKILKILQLKNSKIQQHIQKEDLSVMIK